jgi:hypothetical protein
MKEMCEVHKIKLVKTKVPVSYGEPAFDESFVVAGKLFPNSHKYVLGGCVVDESFPRFSQKMICRECRKAETAWKKENKERNAS